MTELGTVFEDPLSAMVFATISMGFIVAYSFATIWVAANGRNTDLQALQSA